MSRYLITTQGIHIVNTRDVPKPGTILIKKDRKLPTRGERALMAAIALMSCYLVVGLLIKLAPHAPTALKAVAHLFGF